MVISRFVTHGVNSLATVTLENGEQLTGTRQHPIWCENRKEWVPLAELQPGDLTRSRPGLLPVAQVTLLHETQTVYNLEVHDEHVYELLDCGILVHNSEEDCAKIASELLAPSGALGTLARNDDLLAKNLGGRLKDHTPHHLIGVAEAQKFDVMTRAAELGYDINRGTNGINLPNKLDLAKELNLPYHPKRGRHRVKTYTGPIDDRLIELQRRYDKGLINDATLLDEIRKLEDSIHDDLISGKLRLNSRYPWYPQE